MGREREREREREGGGVCVDFQKRKDDPNCIKESPVRTKAWVTSGKIGEQKILKFEKKSKKCVTRFFSATITTARKRCFLNLKL